MNLNRRQFMQAGPAALAVGAASGREPEKKVAALAFMYSNGVSHAKVIFGKLLEGYSPNGVFTRPRTRIVSMFTEQTPPDDLSRPNAPKFGYRICDTVKDALTLGGDELAVDAVCFVGEHGQYPWNEREQHLYPRYEVMERVIEVFRRTGRSVPVFSDKHFSYSLGKARQIYGWHQELKFPFIAGSSIPVNLRTPSVEIPYGAEVESAVALGYGGLDSYGFHTLEALQCMVERRKGGETGIRSVEWLEGDAVWRWRDGAGRWSIPLLEAAMACNPHTKAGRVEDNAKKPAAFVLDYRDGLRAVAYMLSGHTSWWTFSGKVKGSAAPLATHFEAVGARRTREAAHFDGLVHCMEEMFLTGRPLYPVERTYLTTCALSLLFESRAWGRRIETPELHIAYGPPRDTYFQTA
jgi:hypothetical protein